MGKATAAFKATHSRAELVANYLYSLASSAAKPFPALPCGRLK